MMQNHYDRERFAEVHRQDLVREAEHERLLAQLSQPKRHILRLPTRFKISWRALRIRLLHRLQRRTA